MIQLLIICAISVAIFGDPVPDFKDCGSVTGKIDSLDIVPCPSYPCELPRGKNVTITVDLTATSTFTIGRTKVHAIVAGATVPFRVPDPNACHFMACPLNKGDEEHYINAIFVDGRYPKIRLVVKWEIQDEDGKDLICFEVPAIIID